MKYDLVCTVTAAEDGMTVKGVLRKKTGVSRRLIRSIIHGKLTQEEGGDEKNPGCVYVNGKEAAFVDRVREGDAIGLVFPEETTHIEAENIPLDILYEDDDILALNKAPGIVVHPTKGHPSHTVANAVVFHMWERGESYKPRFINRLDMDTSGVLLIGKNAPAQSAFTSQSARGDTEKTYFAAVLGIIGRDGGVIDLPIGLDAENSPRRVVRSDGAPSVTEYRVVDRYSSRRSVAALDIPYTVVEISLQTGRTHQIRVHFSHIGHPLLGDSLYGDRDEDVEMPSVPPRQALHAARLAFNHPSTGRRMIIEAPIPEDICGLFRHLPLQSAH